MKQPSLPASTDPSPTVFRDLPLSFEQPLAFVDLETTGATATADRITEIGIVEVDSTGVREWSALVNPQTRIPEFIERLTGIRNEMVATAPTFGQLANEIFARLGGRLFVAHNARFDYGFLKNEFGRLGIDFRATTLCTVKLSRRLYPQFHKHSLDTLVERHGLAAAERHRALADARLIYQFWQLVRREFSPEQIGEAVATLTARPSLPPNLDADQIENLPEGHGVYLFYGENDLPLYVGKSRQLRKRVLAHFSGDHSSAREMALSQQVRRVECRVTEGEIGALLLESALIKRLQPMHNRQLRRNGDLCAWRLRAESRDLWRPVLVTMDDVDFGRSEDLFGPFKNAREATRTLRNVADAHGLCHGILGLEPMRPGHPCFSHQIRICKGACVGRESQSNHSGRLMAALAKWRMRAWPFKGPAILREGRDAHVIDGWCYLGTARNEDDMRGLVESTTPAFDRDIYNILVRNAIRLVELHLQARAVSAKKSFVDTVR